MCSLASPGIVHVRACLCLCVRSLYLRSSLEVVRNLWQHWQWKSPALGHSSVSVSVCVCLMGYGPFVCAGVRTGSVCGRYLVRTPRKRLLTRSKAWPQEHSLFQSYIGDLVHLGSLRVRQLRKGHSINTLNIFCSSFFFKWKFSSLILKKLSSKRH